MIRYPSRFVPEKCQSPSGWFIKIPKNSEGTVPQSVIPFFCLNSKTGSTTSGVGSEHCFHSTAFSSSNSLCCKTPCHKFEDSVSPWFAAGLSGSSRAGSKDALVQFGEKI